MIFIKNNVLLLLMTLLVTAIGVKPGYGQANQALRDTLRKQTVKEWAWANEDWVGNDASYRQVMADIDRSMSLSKDMSQSLINAKAEAGDRRFDPVAQFRWGYLSYRIAHLPENRNKRASLIGYALFAISKAPSPHTYSYDRLRYLMLHDLVGAEYHMQHLGERLLKKEPNSQDIMLDIILDFNDFYDNAIDLPETKVVTDRKKALVLAKQFVNRYPTNAYGYFALGSVYETSYLRSGNQTDRDNALFMYKRHLQSLTPSSPNYSFVLDKIKSLQDGVVALNGGYAYKDRMPR